jgi:hypothetical protein
VPRKVRDRQVITALQVLVGGAKRTRQAIARAGKRKRI